MINKGEMYLMVLIVGIWMGLKLFTPYFLCPAIERDAGARKCALGVLHPRLSHKTGNTKGTKEKPGAKTGKNENDEKHKISVNITMDLLVLGRRWRVASRRAVLMMWNWARGLRHHSVSWHGNAAWEVGWINIRDDRTTRSFLFVRQKWIF